MSRSHLLIVLGILVLLSPFYGLPMAVLAWILPIFGLSIVAIGVSYRARAPKAQEPIHEASLTQAA